MSEGKALRAQQVALSGRPAALGAEREYDRGLGVDRGERLRRFVVVERDPGCAWRKGGDALGQG